MARREKPLILVRKTWRGLAPASPFDAEQIDALPPRAEFELRPNSRRSRRHQRTYWETLSRVVQATGAWPTKEHLHEALKLDLGYVTPIRDLRGRVHVVPDSTAFDRMTQQEFQAYFERAMARLAETIGTDPLAWLEAA